MALNSTRTTLPHPFVLWLLKALLLVLGITALISGVLMILDPSGQSIDFPDGSLDKSPFSSYLFPGILLTVFVGILPLFSWFSLWKRPGIIILDKLNPVHGMEWAWTLAVVSGAGLVIWILVQMTMIPYFFLQPVLLTWGIAILLLCFSAAVRTYYEK